MFSHILAFKSLKFIYIYTSVLYFQKYEKGSLHKPFFIQQMNVV